MSKTIEEKIDKIPVANVFFRFLKKIKLPGFKGLSVYDLVEMYGIGIIKGTLTTRGGAIAFSFFTAIFPFLLFTLILIPKIPIEGFQTDFFDFLNSVLPNQASEFLFNNIFENIENVEKTNSNGLLSSVFLLSILLMANGVNAIFSGFENSYHVELTRNMFRQYLYAFWVSLILVFLLILTVAVLGYVQIYVLDALKEKEIIEEAQRQVGIKTAKYIFSVLMLYLTTATLYYFGTREGRHSKFFSIGALFTTLLIMFTSYLFGIYINNFAQYNQLYGSIGALLILLVYLWLNANILLLGFELNVSLRKLKAKCE